MTKTMPLIFHSLLASMLLFGCIEAIQQASWPLTGSSHRTGEGSTNSISPPIQYRYPFLFLVKIGIGTFDATSSSPNAKTFKSLNFHLDTGSDISWIQSEGCKKEGNTCFPQKDPLYPNTRSTSYKPIPCNQHSFCQPNHCGGDGSCTFNRTLGPGSYTSGTLGTETLTLSSSNGKLEALKDIILGFSTDTRNSKYALLTTMNISNPVSGVLGLGRGPQSFLAQIDSLSDGKFSYCIKENNTQNTYLRFGKDVRPPKNPQTTKLVQAKTSPAYYVNLLGISVNGVKLNISKTDFDLKSDGSGGCVLDSGTMVSLLVMPAFDTLHKALESNLSSNPHLKRVIIHPKHKDLCYKELSPEGRKQIPTVKFHLENADLEISPGSLFLSGIVPSGDNIICLAILGTPSRNAIGAFQQKDHKFVYDTKAQVLSFGPEDCNQDS
ncbi:unnamed protein product [Dovyalis caffra]|uniref:Peptidase A1 domain-containing protein n=1 Tax=Dovyalis caffra TaxID=77055 RepID=A0AAV1RUZ6_9ROSI|nr:unnamed protein product [Dovyalis caffra]